LFDCTTDKICVNNHTLVQTGDVSVTCDDPPCSVESRPPAHLTHSDCCHAQPPIVGVARPADPTDKKLTVWTKDPNNPIKMDKEGP
jgi:hypothetical protein